MCGRYTLTQNDPQRVAQRFGATLPEGGGLERFNVAPTEPVLAVVNGKTGEREAHLVRWGLVPSYARDLKGPPMFNARSETAAAKSPFAKLVGNPRNRCLIVADGFYEWLRPEDRKAPRVPFRFTVDGGEPFAFAGLWCWSRPQGEWLASATILTCPPNPVVARLHDRMPVILPGPDAEAAWLSADLATDEACGLCVPLAAERMQAAPANPRLNKSGLPDEGPDLLVAA
ncbi:MAG TPA: SOS response-associated peptidase [Solirubrobacteraceae bacterium]|nr:SOS response-associated peptidase [Solirubrobacteraceae bacterium]